MMEPVYGNMKPSLSPSASPTEPRCSKNGYLRAAVVLLWLLSSALLIALIVIGVNYHYSMQRFAELSALKANVTKERDILKASLIDKTNELDVLNQSGRQCPSGWRKYGCSCYLLSTKTGSWEMGRRDCANRSATLVVIDSFEEQVGVLQKFLSNYSTTNTYAWIGLTDSEEERKWKWINGVPLTEKYWRPGQPDNNGGVHLEEDCAHIIFGPNIRGNWNDLPCNISKAWLCEKNVL